MNVVVIGGGFVGQLVQLAVPSARVLDWRKTPPANHLDTRIGPQYLWKPIPGVPSESFSVTTLVDGVPATPETILRYKRKIGKETDGGNWGIQFEHKTVGWTSNLPRPRVEYDRMVRMIDLAGRTLGLAEPWGTVEYDILVSTIPLPALLGLLITGPAYSEFKFDPIYMAEELLPDPVEGMTLDYLSDPADPWYRVTLSGSKRFRESIHPQPGCRKIMPGKIHINSLNESILATLELSCCFCFGRFATWRPDELAHETWGQIERWKKGLAL